MQTQTTLLITIMVAATAWQDCLSQTVGQPRIVEWANNDIKLAVFSSDHQTLAAAGTDFSIRLIESRRGQTLGFLKGHTAGVGSIAFTPDGARLASSGFFDPSLRLWDVKQRRLLSTVDLRGCNVLTFSPDGRTLFTLNFAPKFAGLKAWAIEADASLKCIKEVNLRQRFNLTPSRFLRCSPDGRRVAFEDGHLYVLDVATWTVRRFIDDEDPKGLMRLEDGVFFDDKGWLVAADRVGKLTLWNVADGSVVARISQNVTRIKTIVRLPGTETVLTSSFLNLITASDLSSRRAPPRTASAKLPDGINYLYSSILSDDGAALAVTTADRILLFDVKSLEFK